jgi:sensor histidine kinase YesM
MTGDEPEASAAGGRMSEMTNPTPLPRAIATWLATSVALGAVVGAVFSARRGGSFGDFVQTGAISTLYAASIGLPSMLVFRRLRLRLGGRIELSQWAIYLGVLLATTLGGTLIASLILVAAGVVSFDLLRPLFLQGLQISLAIAVPVSVGVATFTALRARLVTAEASLHAKEREHQRAVALVTEARLASLESRVRPHFLFNALNSAIALIPEDPRRAEGVLERLAGLLRSSLDTAAPVVLLGDELRVVVDYLEIERVRFGDRLRYEIDVPDELRGAAIPSFAIQTVVENSVKYAVSARKDGARISVRGRRGGGRLRIEITDDGPGFTGEIWRAGHGLDALRARLDAQYGDAARLIAPAEVAAGAGAAGEGVAIGATVVIDLPAEAPA